MKPYTTTRFLLGGCLIIVLTGCQAGKFSANSLAFWRNNDRLASEYIEPPSHQFSPAQTEFASNPSTSADDDESLPPLPPNVDRTLDSFEREVAETYQQLAQATENAAEKVAGQIQPVDVDTSHVSSPPASMGRSEFSSPLTPRTVDKSSSTAAAPANNNDFMPSSAPTLDNNPGMTQYEKLAQQTLQPATAPAAPREQSVAPKPVVRTPEFSNPLTPAQGGGSFAAAAEEPSALAQRMQNPYAEQTAAAQPLKPSQASQITAQPPAEPAAVQINYDQYPTTPYRPFESTTTQDAAAAQVAAIPSPAPASLPAMLAPAQPATDSGSGTTGMSLQLQGQGTYAPGSVRAPDSLDPAALKLPLSTGGTTPSSSGGSFQPR